MRSWRPLPTGERCESLPGTIPPSHDGKVLICTQDGSAQVYRVFDPRRGTTGGELGQIEAPTRGLPDAPNQVRVGSSDGLSTAGWKLTF